MSIVRVRAVMHNLNNQPTKLNLTNQMIYSANIDSYDKHPILVVRKVADGTNTASQPRRSSSKFCQIFFIPFLNYLALLGVDLEYDIHSCTCVKLFTSTQMFSFSFNVILCSQKWIQKDFGYHRGMRSNAYVISFLTIYVH